VTRKRRPDPEARTPKAVIAPSKRNRRSRATRDRCRRNEPTTPPSVERFE